MQCFLCGYGARARDILIGSIFLCVSGFNGTTEQREVQYIGFRAAQLCQRSRYVRILFVYKI